MISYILELSGAACRRNCCGYINDSYDLKCTTEAEAYEKIPEMVAKYEEFHGIEADHGQLVILVDENVLTPEVLGKADQILKRNKKV